MRPVVADPKTDFVFKALFGTVERKALLLALTLAGCAAHPHAVPPKGQSIDPLDSAACATYRPPLESDLTGLDAATRAQLGQMRKEGVIAVRYEAKGCDVQLEVLPSCSGKGLYEYTASTSSGSRILDERAAVLALLPLGATRLAAKLSSDRSLRIDTRVAGLDVFPTTAADYLRSSLHGTLMQCDKATHVVRSMTLGAFGVIAGPRESLSSTQAFAPAGKGVEKIALEGALDACDRASKDHLETEGCLVPIHAVFLPIEAPGTTHPLEAPTPPPSASPFHVPPPQPTDARDDSLPAIPETSAATITVQHLLVSFAGASRASPTVTRTRAQAQIRAQQALGRIQAGEDFTSVVISVTDEPLPNPKDRKAGVLSNVRRGMMVRRFESAAFSLTVNAISNVIETEFGFHVIKRLE